MIVKDKFLERCRVELAIGAEFKCHRCHPIGLTRSVDPKSVSFALCDAHNGVEKWRGEKEQCAENQRQQRKSSWIGYSAYAPFLAPASDSCIKHDSGNCESYQDTNTQIGQQLRTMI